MQSLASALLVLSLLLPAPAGHAQPARLSGRVLLPAGAGQKPRAFRAALYRSRQTPAGKMDEEKKKAALSPYADVVISAHPLSFTPQVEPFSRAVEVEQVGVAFQPRVVVITPGTVVEFINQDEIYHNVFSLTPGARFNIGRRPTGEIVPHKFESAGKVDLFCDIHPQMHAVVLSLDTPYFARADDQGAYALEDLPAGTYELRLFHPDVQPASSQVELGPGEARAVDFQPSR
jgi:plastocyanin